MITPDLSDRMPEGVRAVHFVGIGGSGMSGVARMFLDAGYRVTGSDRSDSDHVADLRRHGAEIWIGHDAAHVAGADVIVVTSAIWPDNPELTRAKAAGMPVLHRSQALAWLASGRRLVAVAGAHGKTTSTGMIVTGLIGLGADPGFVNGGVIEALGTSAAPGSGELFVVEADESDGTFLLYDPAVALVTNVEADHIDHYGSMAAFERAFVDFASGVREFAAVSADDPGAREMTAHLGGTRVVTFGESAADVRVHAIDTSAGPVSFEVEYRGIRYPGRLRIPGRHNALNAAGAFAVLTGLGFDPRGSLDAIGDFAGTERRFELHGTIGGVSVYDDYAHHPAEVAAVLSAARTVVGDGRIIAVHQPHLYSRTARLAGEFAAVLEEHADATVVLDVCGAREDPVPGVTGELVSRRFADAGRVAYVPDWQEAADYTAGIAERGDYVITLGCGDVNLIIPQLLEALQRTRG